MSVEQGTIEVVDAPEAHRYEAHRGPELLGFLDYRNRGDGRLVLVHTEVDPAYEGQGVGSALARHALEDARARRLSVVPRCPFVLAYLRRHKEYADLVVPAAPACSHLEMIREVAPSATGCEDCLRIGGTWVHLRLCRTCGHVGCCDSSPNRHASAHARETEHPIVRSIEPGESWSWCYVDELLLEQP
ncbi:MAG TPA: GNAT family N-acetyltransferase [Candidatus Limnocylindrales bacterium]